MTRLHTKIIALASGATAVTLIAALAALPVHGASTADFTMKVAIFPTNEIHHEFGRKFEQRL